MELIKKVIYLFFYIFFVFHKKKRIIFSDKKKLFYPYNFGFGDYVFFCSRIYPKLNKFNKVFCYSKQQFETAKFFINEKFIEKPLFLLPKRLSELYFYHLYLKKSSLFKPTYLRSPHNKKYYLSNYYIGDKKLIKFVKERIKKNKLSSKILKISKKKYLCLYIKNYPIFKKDKYYFQLRQSYKLNPIYKLINFLNKKKINIIILGKNNDNFIKTLPINIKNLRYVYLFKDLSNKYNLHDQAFIAMQSNGYIGSNSGANAFFGLFLKKHLIVNDIKQYSHRYWLNFLFIYKKTKNKKTNKLKIMRWNEKKININKFDIIENNYLQLISGFKKIFNL